MGKLNMDKGKLEFIVKDIDHYFGFLYPKGFKIRNTEYSPKFMGNWVVELESSNCIIYITNDRNNLTLEFTTLKKTDTRDRVGIERMIYLASGGKNIINRFEGNSVWGKKEQFERLSNLLSQHLEQITTYLSSKNF